MICNIRRRSRHPEGEVKAQPIDAKDPEGEVKAQPIDAKDPEDKLGPEDIHY